jgi:hypothetical protein
MLGRGDRRAGARAYRYVYRFLYDGALLARLGEHLALPAREAHIDRAIVVVVAVT